MLTLSHIKRYIELGFVVHPCCPADHKCLSPGKIPYDPPHHRHMDGWQDHSQFPLWRWEEWVDYDSSINIGVLCGSPSGILMIDIDNEGAHGRFKELNGQREEGYWAFRTGRGLRFIYRNGEEPAGSYKIPTGTGDYLEILGDGRQSVLPPSLHPNGQRYKWIDEFTPRDYIADTAPEWTRNSQTLSRGNGEDREDEGEWRSILSAPTTEGGRNDTLTKLCGHLLAPQPLPPNEVRLWMNAYNIAFCKPKLSDEELNTIINSITRREDASEGVLRKIQEMYDCPRDTAIEYLLQNPELANL